MILGSADHYLFLFLPYQLGGDPALFWHHDYDDQITSASSVISTF